jgi:hypothetical protein
MSGLDQLSHMECVLAVIDLGMRSGARNFEVGYLNEVDEVPHLVWGPQWWAKVQYRGARLTCEKQDTPALACDGLAHMILDGGTCMHCQLRTTTAQTDMGMFLHGRPPEPGEPVCRWYREGDAWKRGCE